MGPTSTVDEVRRALLNPPAGFGLRGVEFADVNHGYATFWSFEPVNLASNPRPEDYRYATAMFATGDGGRTWRTIIDPRPPTSRPELIVCDASSLVLWATPTSWYVSADGGATFRLDVGLQDPPCRGVGAGFGSGQYRAVCGDACTAIARSDSGRETRLDPGPELPGGLTAVVDQPTGAVWAASVDGPNLYTALSRDRGETWRSVVVPAHPAGVPNWLELQVSADGADVWLIGYAIHGAGGLGSAMPRLRKPFGPPILWRAQDDRWVPAGHTTLANPDGFYSAAAIGAGLAVVTGPDMVALVDEAWHPVELFPRPAAVLTRRDGTIFAPTTTNEVFYLGTRRGTQVHWVKVELDHSASTAGHD